MYLRVPEIWLFSTHSVCVSIPRYVLLIHTEAYNRERDLIGEEAIYAHNYSPQSKP